MKKPRILVLVMSCNDNFFRYSLQVANNTWMKDIINYPNIRCASYVGKSDNPVSFPNNIMCECEDDIDHTFEKTIEAFKQTDAARYDYVVRTNTSTYINIRVLDEFLTEKFNSDKANITCCGDISIFENHTQLRGNSLILTKKDVIDILNHEEIPDWVIHHDDTIISYIWEQNRTSNESRLNIIKNNIQFVPCIYFNDIFRYGHPLAIFDKYCDENAKCDVNSVFNSSIFISVRKNSGDRYGEFGECYKIHNATRNSNDKFFNPNACLVWLYDTKRFIEISI